MFSLGCLLFELCTLRQVFPLIKYLRIYHALHALTKFGSQTYRCPDLRHRGLKRATALLLPTRYSPELSEIIQTLLYIDVPIFF
jgi:hypothetical protein